MAANRDVRIGVGRLCAGGGAILRRNAGTNANVRTLHANAHRHADIGRARRVGRIHAGAVDRRRQLDVPASGDHRIIASLDLRPLRDNVPPGADDQVIPRRKGRDAGRLPRLAAAALRAGHTNAKRQAGRITGDGPLACRAGCTDDAEA